MDDQLVKDLTELFQETAREHHEAYLSTDGHDPEWPLWYSNYLQTKLPDLLDAELTRSEIVYLLVRLDRQQKIDAPGARWNKVYARRLAELYG